MSLSKYSFQRHLREGSEICEELIATDRLLGSNNNEEEDEDLLDPERLTYFQVIHHFWSFTKSNFDQLVADRDDDTDDENDDPDDYFGSDFLWTRY